MFCGKCGSEIQDGLEICSKCGKSPTDAVIKNEDAKVGNYPLINLSSKLFYPMFELGLWFFLIVGTVGGGIAGYFIGQLISYRDGGGTGAFLGVIIGFFLSFVAMINYGGKTAITLKANAEKVLKK
jgi:hypothetical protein